MPRPAAVPLLGGFAHRLQRDQRLAPERSRAPLSAIVTCGIRKSDPTAPAALVASRPGRHTPAHQVLPATPAARPLGAFQRGAPYWTSHSYPVSGPTPPAHSPGSLDWRDPSPIADPALGSEGTVGTQLAHSMDAQMVELRCVGVVGQSLDKSSLLVLGTI